MKQAKVEYLVVDSGAFIRNAPIHEYGENVYTVHNIVKEIKDKATKQRLQVLPYDLKFQEPTPENIKYVTEFSKKTGDYPSLSAVDIQVIALTYQLEKQNVGTDHLNKDPVRGKVTAQPAEISRNFVGFYYPDDDDEEELKDEEEESGNLEEKENKESNHSDSSPEPEGDKSVEEAEPESDLTDCNQVHDKDDDHWITPSNIEEIKKKMGILSITSDDSQSVHVACITTDFAVQNMLLQMGLHVISVDGMLIKHTKVFILRCYACFSTTSIMTKQFCPGCGNKTLKRVAVSFNEDGSKKIHINFRKPINIRGTKYSLPQPRGGKHAENPVLCEDQPVPQNRPSKSALAKVDMFSPDYETRSSPFAMNDVYSRAAQLGIRKANISVSKRNPNEPVRRVGKKNKKT